MAMTRPEASLLPLHLLLHVGGVAVAVVGQQQATVAQPVDVDLDVRAVHDQDVRGRGLTRHLAHRGGGG